MAAFGLKKKLSSSAVTAGDAAVLDVTTPAIVPDEVSVTSKVSPLCRPRFRRTTNKATCGGGNESTTGNGRRENFVPKSLDCSGNNGKSVDSGGGAKRGRSPGSCGGGLQPTANDTNRPSPDQRRGSNDGGCSPNAATGSGVLTLEPRIRQYERSELLQDRSPETGLSEVESFLLEKQRQMDEDDESGCGGETAGGDEETSGGGLVPRAPFYQPHPLLQIRTEVGMTELELYLLEKEASLQPDADGGGDRLSLATAASRDAKGD